MRKWRCAGGDRVPIATAAAAMSFKREGDDPSQLGVLQKRRVADLLANYIPEDEALLLRSGRYTCTVCAHRPIFDTLDVLTAHRAGKKHLSSLQRFYGRKRSPQDVAPRPQQEEEAPREGAGGQAPLLARTRRIARSALLKAAPYSSCCRRMGAEGSSWRSGITGTGLTQTPPEPPREEGGAGTGTAGAVRAAAARRQRAGKGKTSSLDRDQPLSPERRRELERFLQLRSAGWIQDLSGRWVKDQNAEFDSDEEEPPPALLPA
ncbi:sodium channel modifier 1 isoform X2 [Calypte anna]|uniref:sodium channel modifier 1 isoform X2 n=1 Tax=Calypte anna TaxID=9244 RepID=UPI0011C4A842|nr:sodium channel modifier 1 isoform X2 [Calypte anna]